LIGESLAEIRELIAELDDPRSVGWRVFAAWLAASERGSGREFSAERAVAAFYRALQANADSGADTFMAHATERRDETVENLAPLAVARGCAAAHALRELDGTSRDQPLLRAVAVQRGWLEMSSIDGDRNGPEGVPVAFILPRGTFVAARVGDRWRLERDRAGIDDEGLVRVIAAAMTDRAPPPRGLQWIDARDSAPTPAAVAVSVAPVALARSLHRSAWTRGGGPWLGVGTAGENEVTSTCHVAADGFVHARITSLLLVDRRMRIERHGASWGRSAREARGPASATTTRSRSAVAEPGVGFAGAIVAGAAPRFARVVHAYGRTLEEFFGPYPYAPCTVPFHVPMVPGAPSDSERWRRRAVYGLLSLRRRAGEIETEDELAGRLSRFIARESAGRGLLVRTLRALLELPVPDRMLAPMLRRYATVDRWVRPALVVGGYGYVSWMRFPPGEAPALPLFPSALPGFASAGCDGVGLSIVPCPAGISVGVTTTGSLGTDDGARAFVDAWSRGLRDRSVHAASTALR